MRQIKWAFPFLFLVACAKPKQPQYLGFQNVRMEKAGLSESIVGADVKFFNPNKYNLRLRKASLDLYLNENYVGHSDLDTLIVAPALDSFSVPVRLNLQLKQVLKNGFELILNPDVMLKVKGNARIGKSGIYVNVPIDYQGKQRIDVLLRDTTIRKILGE